MAKGSKRNRIQDDDGNNAPKRQRTAPQAAAHRRGGTHRVKDDHRTGTHWDEKNYQELLYAIKARDGLYVKDMKKHEIARKLAWDDWNKEKKERAAQKNAEKEAKRTAEIKTKAQELEQLKKTQTVSKHEDRERRRDAGGDDVSDTTEEEAPVIERYGIDMVGDVEVEDEGEESEISENPTSASISPIFPRQKLRIFEWPYHNMPTHQPPRLQQRGAKHGGLLVTDELIPRKIPYAVMTLVTMPPMPPTEKKDKGKGKRIEEENKKEKRRKEERTEKEKEEDEREKGERKQQREKARRRLELPGRSLPEAVGPDFVPRIPQHVIDCCRNGIMVGALRKAVVERGKDWAKRTRLQGFNGRMFFNLSPRNTSTPLSDVYAKWNKDVPPVVRAMDPKTGKLVKRDRKTQEAQRKEDKRAKLIDVFAASEWRPPICYLPAYLEYSEPKDDPENKLTIENLFYVRFPGMDLPHFYFWTYEGDWEDPTLPNPEWADAKVEDKEEERQEAIRREQVLGTDGTNDRTHTFSDADLYRHSPILDRTKLRIKKSKIPLKFRPTAKQLKASKYKTALWTIEGDFYCNGLTKTLLDCRTRWLKAGKEQHWKHLSQNLPELYPSGKLPDAPPVHVNNRVPETSLAEKLASVDVLSKDRQVAPIKGDEPWTRDDNAYWDVIDAIEVDSEEEGVTPALLRPISPLDFKPASIPRCPSSEISAWLEDLSPTYTPPSIAPSLVLPLSPINERSVERRVWEKLFEEQAEERLPRRTLLQYGLTYESNGGAVEPIVSKIEAMPVAELKWQLYSLMKHNGDQQCQICLESLNQRDPMSVEEHYQSHQEDADLQCPFCGIEWGTMDTRWKSSHIYSHDIPSPQESPRRRRSSMLSVHFAEKPFSLPSNARRRSTRLSAFATRPQVETRRSSRVHFSPQTVEKRIVYNDRSEDTEMDADVDSIATISPKRSSLRTSASSSSSKRGGLRIDTSARVTKRIGKGKNGNRSRNPIEVAYYAPSTPSKHIPSPEPHLVRRRLREDPESRLDARRYSASGSEHIPSPHLPNEASWDPKGRKSPAESLDWYTGRRKWTTAKNSQAKGKGKTPSKQRRISKGEAPQVLQALAPVGDDGNDKNSSTVSIASSDSLAMSKSKGKRRVSASTSQPRPEVGEVPQILQSLAPENPADDFDHDTSTLSNASTSSFVRREKALRSPDLDVIGVPKGLAAKRGKKRKAVGLGISAPGLFLDESENSIVTAKASKARVKTPTSSRDSRRRSSAGSTPHPATRRKLSQAIPAALHGWDFDPDLSGGWGDENFVEINDVPSLGYDSEQMTGNPFAPPPKNSRTKKAAVKPKTKAKSKVVATPEDKVAKVKKLTPKQTTLAAKKAAAEAELAARQASRVPATSTTPNSPAANTTLSGRPFVEPLVLAQAKRYSKADPKKISTPVSATPTSASSSKSKSKFKSTPSPDSVLFEPPTPSIAKSKARSPKQLKTKFLEVENGDGNRIGDDRNRGRRSSAPTPSPSIVLAPAAIDGGLKVKSPSTPKTKVKLATASKAPKTRSASTSKAPISTSPASPRSAKVTKSKPPVTPKPKFPTSRKSSKSSVTFTDQISNVVNQTVSLPVLRKYTYDIPFSDPRPLVPPNTPATHLFNKGKGKRSSVVEGMLSEVGGGALDVGKLRERIGKVKTTKSGLVRELTASGSLSGKRKRGPKAKADMESKIAPEQRAEKTTKAAMKTKGEKEKEAGKGKKKNFVLEVETREVKKKVKNAEGEPEATPKKAAVDPQATAKLKAAAKPKSPMKPKVPMEPKAVSKPKATAKPKATVTPKKTPRLTRTLRSAMPAKKK